MLEDHPVYLIIGLIVAFGPVIIGILVLIGILPSDFASFATFGGCGRSCF